MKKPGWNRAGGFGDLSLPDRPSVWLDACPHSNLVPFSFHVCTNGREWLARRMDQASIAYSRQQNCFPWLQDYGRAYELFDEQLRVNWTKSPTFVSAPES
jgi:hypothetical protein